VVVLGLGAGLARGTDPPVPGKGLTPGAALGLLDGSSPAALAGNLRAYLLQALPAPLFEDQRHWGVQKAVREVKWRGKGLRVHPEVEEVPENDGRWWKVRVSAANPADSLVLDLRDVDRPGPGRLTFTAFVSLDANVEFDRQTWHEGARLYSGSVRARMRLKLTLRCEAEGRLEGKGFLPEAVVRLRVVGSDFRYDNFVVEHIAGMGGEAARLLGDAARAGAEQWHPSLERSLVARANEAIVKAGDTREVRVGLMALLGKK
jgi:hypothetical protein